MEKLVDENPNLVFIQETWLRSKKSYVTSLIKDYGYQFPHQIRKNREKEEGGGVGILVKSGTNFKQIKQNEFSSFEKVTLRIQMTQRKSFLMVSIYRVLFIPINIFLEEFVTFLETMITMKDDLLIAGDINIHMDDCTCTYAKKFQDILDSFNLVQHVKFITHIQGHTLDVIITYKDSPIVKNIEFEEYDISHHHLIKFKVEVEIELKIVKEIKFRKLKNIDSERFTRDIQNSFAITEKPFGELITSYNEKMQKIIDDHAPVIKKTIKIVPEAPWFDGEYIDKRKKRRKAEKVYKRTRLQDDKKAYINLRKETLNLARKKKCEYYRKKLTSNEKILFSSVNKLIDDKKENILPDAESDKSLADSFQSYFLEKIEKIRASFHKDSNVDTDMPTSENSLFEFERTNDEEVKQIITAHGAKCAPDDPMPSEILNQYKDVFIPIWTKLINLSFDTGSMDCLKSAIVFPLIKELDDIVDRDIKKNYRPVSNLQFISKLIERVVKIRLNKHMKENNLNSDFEHGYKEEHSTETLLLKAINDLLIACDNQQPTVVLLLDLSAAFDTVDQEILLEILEEEIGIKGRALDWFRSFLIGRTQRVKIGESYSYEAILKFGIGQGTILSPDLFNIYIRSLKKIIDRIRFIVFGFADDHQLMKKFLPAFQRYALDDDINDCFKLITEWMNHFFLRLNSAKTKILVFIPPNIRNEIKIEGTYINNECVRFVHSSKNLGVILDDELSFNEQVTKVVKTCFMIIRKISKVKEFLTTEELRTVISARILSRLDYCNSIYYGINATQINKLQSVQNSAARLIYKTNTTSSTVDSIRKCHWLEIRARILFKICLMVHKCIHGNAPTCLKELLTNVSSERTKRLLEYKYNTNFGSRAFIRIGPKIWNILPRDFRTEENKDIFKKKLKTYFFDNFGNVSLKLIEK